MILASNLFTTILFVIRSVPKWRTRFAFARQIGTENLRTKRKYYLNRLITYPKRSPIPKYIRTTLEKVGNTWEVPKPVPGAKVNLVRDRNTLSPTNISSTWVTRPTARNYRILYRWQVYIRNIHPSDKISVTSETSDRYLVTRVNISYIDLSSI